MGSWGTGISANDTFEDIKDEFYELYNEGLELNEITNRLINSNGEITNDKEDANNFWFALALCQWECKALEPEILERITKIIKSGADIELWKELGSEKSELTKRQKALNKFLEKLNSEKKSARKRKKKIFRDSIFRKGDCLTYKMRNGNYGAACVLEEEKQTEFGLNLIAICDYDHIQKPTIDYFKHAEVLMIKEQGNWSTEFVDVESVAWYYAEFFKKLDTDIEVIGKIEVKIKYLQEQDYRRFSTNWDGIPEQLNWKEEREAERGKAENNLKLRSLRKKTWL